MAIGENIPLYFRIYHKLKQEIITGELEKGSKIESIEELAKQYEVSQASIRKSLDLLEMEGLLIKKQGRGTVVPESANLHPIDVVRLISIKNIASTMANSSLEILEADWVLPGPRLIRLYKMDPATQEPVIYRIFTKMTFPENVRLKAITIQYFNKRMLEELKVEEDTTPPDILMKMSKWGETHPLEMTHSLRPYLCTDRNAELLGLPDGTPVFCQDFMTRATGGICHFFEMVSTANLHVHKQKLNEELDAGN